MIVAVVEVEVASLGLEVSVRMVGAVVAMRPYLVSVWPKVPVRGHPA